MSDNFYTIMPRDTLILRDGKPTNGSVYMSCLFFPWPTSIAGLVRTKYGKENNYDFNKTENIEQLKAIEVSGPWLCEVNGNSEVIGQFFPAPLDVFWVKQKNNPQAQQERLKVEAVEEKECLSDLPYNLRLIEPPENIENNKPEKNIARFWSLSEYKAWLINSIDTIKGLKNLQKETRLHVKINNGVAEDGQLFETEAIRFTSQESKHDEADNSKTVIDNRQFALAFNCNANVQNGAVTVGGKGTVSYLGKNEKLNEVLDELRTKVLEKLKNLKEVKTEYVLRVIFITPAIFNGGFIPDADDELSKIKNASDKESVRDIESKFVPHLRGAEVIAVRCDRGQFISGWDMANNCPKPSRRVVPAGSVYWVKFTDKQSAIKWAEDNFYKCLSDNEQDCRDGFGMCVIGL